MSRAMLALALVGISSLAACGGGSQQNVKSPEAQAEAKLPDENAAKSDAPKDDKAAKKDDNTFKGYDPGIAVKLTGPKAWTLGPGDDWTIGLYDYVRADGTKNVFKEFGGGAEFAIPGAYTFPATPAKDLKKGDPVYVPVGPSAQCGRVLSVSDKEIKVAYIWAHDRDENTYAPEEVLPFDGKLGYGAPVVYKEEPDHEGWTPGHLVYKDDKSAWLENNLKVPLALVKPIDVKKTHKIGDKVLAIPTNSLGILAPGTVTKVLYDGLAYDVEYEDGETKPSPYCGVTASPK